MPSDDQQFAFGPFRLDAGERRLLDAGGAVLPLRDKVFETLLVLVRSPGRLLTKEELIDAIWPDHHVAESNLNHNISVLRKTLGDSIGAPRYIETIPKHGFRFIAEVRPRAAADWSPLPASPRPRRRRLLPAAATAAMAVTLAATAVVVHSDDPPPARTVTVMPFRYLSDSPARGYVAPGLSEALTSRLGAIGRISVRPPDARPRSDAIVSGAVQASGDDLRITVSILDTHSGREVWSRQFDVQPSEVLAMEDVIAQNVGDELRPGLTPEERAHLTKPRSSDPVAVEEYLRARDLLDRRLRFEEAISHLKRAVARDPRFALAWAALGEAKAYPGSGAVDVSGATDAATRSVTLAPDLAEGHATLGFIAFFYRWDWTTADRELKRALRLNPGSARVHDWYAVTQAVRGNMREAFAELSRARQIDPASLDMANDAVLLALLSHDYAAAERSAREVLDRDPSQRQARAYLIGALTQQRRWDEAIVEASIADDANPLNGVSRALLRLTAGRHEDRAALVRRLDEAAKAGAAPDVLAALYARAGERQKALDCLERAGQAHAFGVVFAARNPDYAALRDEPRFVALLSRLGLATPGGGVTRAGGTLTASR